jgi:hypothetical protein
VLVDAVNAGPLLASDALLDFKDGLSHLLSDPTDLRGAAGIALRELANNLATESFVLTAEVSDFAEALGKLSDTGQGGGDGDGTGVTALQAMKQGTTATIPKVHTAPPTKPVAVTSPATDSADHATADTDTDTDTKDNSLFSRKSVPKSGTDSTTIKSDATMGNVTKSDNAKSNATSSGASKSPSTNSIHAESANVSGATQSSSAAAKTPGSRALDSSLSSVKVSVDKADKKPNPGTKKSGKPANKKPGRHRA